MSKQEIWKDYTGSIKQFHGLIRVSNMGRVFKKGTNTSKNKSGILKGTRTSQGYIRVHVSINGKTYNKAVHRLVAETFCSNPYDKPYVDHKNAIRHDNRADNLHWVTHQENCQNPNYTKVLSKQKKAMLAKHNHLAERNKKACYAEHKNGQRLYFDSMKDLQEHFDCKANIKRKLKSGEYFTSRKSKLYGWRIRLVQEIV